MKIKTLKEIQNVAKGIEEILVIAKEVEAEALVNPEKYEQTFYIDVSSAKIELSYRQFYSILTTLTNHLESELNYLIKLEQNCTEDESER